MILYDACGLYSPYDHFWVRDPYRGRAVCIRCGAIRTYDGDVFGAVQTTRRTRSEER